MIRMINPFGGETWVHETRVDEYLEAGHRLAPPPEPPKRRPRKAEKTDDGKE